MAAFFCYMDVEGLAIENPGNIEDLRHAISRRLLVV